MVGVGRASRIRASFGADNRHLYVSNWGSRSVSLVDTRDRIGACATSRLACARTTWRWRRTDGCSWRARRQHRACHPDPRRWKKPAPEASPASAGLPEDTREIISTSLYPQSPEGSTPDAVAVSAGRQDAVRRQRGQQQRDGGGYFERAVEDARRNRESVSVVDGFIPVGWYPSAVCVSPDNQTLFVANGKGLASQANYPRRNQTRSKRRQRRRHLITSGACSQGSVSFITRPDAAQMAAYTEQVRRNSPYTPGGAAARAHSAEQQRHPRRSRPAVPDQIRALHHQGEPDLRPGDGRH